MKRSISLTFLRYLRLPNDLHDTFFEKHDFGINLSSWSMLQL